MYRKIKFKFLKKWFGSKMVIYSLEELIRIEESLNEIQYKGQPIGGLFASSLYPGLFLSRYTINPITLVLKYLQYLKYYIQPLFTFRSYNIPEGNFTYLFNYSANTPRLTNFFLPLINLIELKESILIVCGKGNRLKDDSISFFENKRLNIFDYVPWLIEFASLIRVFRKNERFWREKHHLDWQILFGLRITLLHQSQSLFILNKLLKKTKPTCILTDHDRQTFNAALVVQGKIQQIPTFTFIHGGTIPIANFVPLVADTILCWGELHEKQFAEYGIDKSRIKIVGNSQLEKPETNLPTLTDTVVFISNPLENDDKFKLAIYFCESILLLSKTRSIKSMVKLHPSEHKADYAHISRKYPEIKFVSSDEISNADLYKTCDLFVSHNSTMGFEALIKNKKVIILNPPDIYFHIGIGKQLVEDGGCLEATNAEQLSTCIDTEIVNIEQKISNLKAASYISAYCKYFGKESAIKVLETIKP